MQKLSNNQWYLDLNSLNPPKRFYDWLVKPYNIGAVMRNICDNLTLRLLSQQFQQPLADESAILEISSNNKSLIRQIYLQGNDLPWSYGRVIIPYDTYQAYQVDFDKLQSKLIGETLLYGNKNTSRSEFEFAKLYSYNFLFQEAIKYLTVNFNNKILWGRRSIFSIKQYKLMITEIYFPSIPNYPEVY